MTLAQVSIGRYPHRQQISLTTRSVESLRELQRRRERAEANVNIATTKVFFADKDLGNARKQRRIGAEARATVSRRDALAELVACRAELAAIDAEVSELIAAELEATHVA